VVELTAGSWWPLRSRISRVGGDGRDSGEGSALVMRFPFSALSAYSAYSASIAALVLFTGAAILGAQADHGAQYSQAEIAAGYRIYSATCVQCHGGNGDGISGVDLRR